METPVQFQAAGLLSVLCIALFIYRTIKERNTLPGPPRWPIIGNAHYMPRKTHWKTFSAWKKKYGEQCLSVKVLHPAVKLVLQGI